MKNLFQFNSSARATRLLIIILQLLNENTSEQISMKLRMFLWNFSRTARHKSIKPSENRENFFLLYYYT